MLKDQKVSNFLENLASKSATPGGGSVAALTAAMGAALLSMVNNLTIGKEKYQAVEDDIRKLLEKSEKLRNDLEYLIERDVMAFNAFMAALKMPKNNEQQKRERQEKMQNALTEAAHVPLEVAQKSMEVITISDEVAKIGNKNVISDAGVGVILAEAALESALLNVKINLNMIKNENIKDNFTKAISELMALKGDLKQKVLKKVEDRL